jgi:hypothetical protein
MPADNSYPFSLNYSLGFKALNSTTTIKAKTPAFSTYYGNDIFMVHKDITSTDPTVTWYKFTTAVPANYPHPAIHLQSQPVMNYNKT